MKGNCGECESRWFCDINPDECDAWTDPVPQTNADHVRAMTDEKLAVFLECFGVCHYCQEYEEASFVEYGIPDCDGDCGRHLMDWLKQPHKE